MEGGAAQPDCRGSPRLRDSLGVCWAAPFPACPAPGLGGGSLPCEHLPGAAGPCPGAVHAMLVSSEGWRRLLVVAQAELGPWQHPDVCAGGRKTPDRWTEPGSTMSALFPLGFMCPSQKTASLLCGAGRSGQGWAVRSSLTRAELQCQQCHPLYSSVCPPWLGYFCSQNGAGSGASGGGGLGSESGSRDWSEPGESREIKVLSNNPPVSSALYRH